MKSRSDKAPYVIMNALMITSIFGSIINSTILGISAAEGKWILGDVFCQLYALLSFTLVSGTLWLIALAAFERWYKLVAVNDYSSTFSEINTRILIKGVLMVAFGLCTGPVYGWGEYSYFKGLMTLTGSIHLPDMNSTRNASTMDIPYLCQKTKQNQEKMIIEMLVESIKIYMEKHVTFHVRSSKQNCVLGDIEMVIRALHTDALNIMQQKYKQGSLQIDLEREATLTLGNLTEEKRYIKVPIFINESQITEYKNKYLSFQELGVCTLDISPVNVHVISATAYIIFTTVIIPFGIILLCGLHVFIRYHTGSSSRCYSDIKYLKIIFICGFISMVLCVPYYTINILNSNGSIISTVSNFICTFLFYNCSLCVSIPYIVYRLPRLNVRTNALTLRHFGRDTNIIRRDSNDISAASEFV